MVNPRFLLVSLGNQMPYYETLHSAGHFALRSLQNTLGASQPRFQLEKFGKQPCQVSYGYPYMMIQSPTMMNACGPWVATAWNEILEKYNLKPSELGLVLVHDDLEEALGVVRTRKWKMSHRGHNGVRSVNRSLKKSHFPGAKWFRISVGIDRPVGRDSVAVSEYVLSTMTSHQRDVLDTKVGPRVVACLQQLHHHWGEEGNVADCS
ncbi:peptidyl-tRNA hydrolase [Xylariales sp. AK1849]|nr:peptidyl-tRNA hydrolase [Xylariales sp. AK1849]